MAICRACGAEQALYMSDVCGNCSGAPAPAVVEMVQASETSTSSPLSEGDYASMIGKAIILLSIAGAAICIFSMGRMEVPDGLYGTRTVWSGTLIVSLVAAGLNGVFFGFLLDKVGSVLRRLERIRALD